MNTYLKSLIICLCIISSALIAAGCGGEDNGKSNELAANSACVVDGNQVSKEDVERELKQLEAAYAQQKQEVPKAGTEEYKALQSNIIDYIVQRNLVKQAADEEDLSVSDKEVDASFKQLREQYLAGGSDEAYLADLEKQGITETDLKEDLRLQLLTEKLHEKISKEVKISDKEGEAYFDTHKEQFAQKTSRDVSHILVGEKSLIDNIYAKLKNGEDFAELAKKNSIDASSAKEGGQLTVAKGETVPAFDKIAFSLKKGQFSKPFKSEFGWHVILANSAITPPKEANYQDNKKEINELALQEKKNKTLTDYMDGLYKDLKKSDSKCAKGYSWEPREAEAVVDVSGNE